MTKARLLGLVVGIFGLASGLLWLGLEDLKAQGMDAVMAKPTFITEGRNPIAFNVDCATAPWVMVQSSSTISRSTFMQSVSSNTQAICLIPQVSTPSVSLRCSTSTVGVELGPGQGYTDYTRASWWCAASSGTTSQALKGVRARDKGDYGQITDPSLQ